jgi:3-isopropylmalate/(R)-2-methylmalate dehydratase small subunit
MEPFTTLTAVAAPIDLVNVDTDRIIPARFLRERRGPGFERFLFHDVRFGPDGAERPEFILNQAPFRAARILVAAENFACGSSREAAVWALVAYGFRAFIAPSFGDIFAQNCGKNGALAVRLPGDTVARLRAQLHERPGSPMTVDLLAQTVTGPDGGMHAFEVDEFLKECLVRGQDEIALTLEFGEAIAAFEERRAREMPWIARAAAPVSPTSLQE